MAKRTKKLNQEQKIARKIQGWLPEDNLDVVANKLQFIGLSLTAGDNLEGIPESALIGAGDIILDLAKELDTIDGQLSEFCLKLSELTTGKPLRKMLEVDS